MSDSPTPPPSDTILREGLRRLPVPTLSPDFDAVVLAALRQPSRPWWQTLWAQARPLLAGTACSLVAMLALLHWTTQAPITTPRLSPMPRATISEAAIERALDRPDLRADALAHLPEEPDPALPAAVPERRPKLIKRAGRARPATLFA